MTNKIKRDSPLVNAVLALDNHCRPSWFDQLEPVLHAIGTSYYDDSACHLDLVQWATDPVWSKIPDRAVRRRLVFEDAEFLRLQLTHSDFAVILINGTGVLRQFESVMKVKLKRVGMVTGSATSSSLWVGGMRPSACIVAWSINIQSSFGVCNVLRARLANAVSKLITTGVLAPNRWCGTRFRFIETGVQFRSINKLKSPRQRRFLGRSVGTKYMNVESTLKDDFFRPLAITIVPGSLAVAPVPLVVAYYVRQVQDFWDEECGNHRQLPWTINGLRLARDVAGF